MDWLLSNWFWVLGLCLVAYWLVRAIRSWYSRRAIAALVVALANKSREYGLLPGVDPSIRVKLAVAMLAVIAVEKLSYTEVINSPGMFALVAAKALLYLKNEGMATA